MKTTPISISLDRISILGDDLSVHPCLTCGSTLEFHQPDSGFTERILGTCECCKSWYLIDLIPDEAAAVMVCLPDPQCFRGALES